MPDPGRNCLRDTGTRLELPEGACVAARGRVIGREELERTPGVSLDERLRRLGTF